jgi:hypothetical protein
MWPFSNSKAVAIIDDSPAQNPRELYRAKEAAWTASHERLRQYHRAHPKVIRIHNGWMVNYLNALENQDQQFLALCRAEQQAKNERDQALQTMLRAERKMN